MINTIILGNALIELPKLPAELVSCVVCSPPYWGLRDYSIKPVIWDGDKNCKHIFSIDTKCGDIRFRGKNSIVGSERNPKVWEGDGKGQFCNKCNAWRGSLGLEPTFDLYIKHLCDIFDEVKRVLRKDGVCFVNIGDTYAGGGGWTGVPDNWKSISTASKQKRFDHNKKNIGIPAKSLCDIPYHFSTEMINRGWIKRNTIIWHKPNCMPESADDRFTVDFEYLFFFSKSNKTLFWTNEKTLECVSKKLSGTKGIEGKDWEWIICPACEGNIKDKICPRCKDSGKVKYSFWSGHDYWFEQQFEKYAPVTLPRMDRGVNINKWTMGADGQSPHNLSQPRPRKARGYSTKQINEEKHRQQHHGQDINYGKNGRNKRCVWKIPTKSFKEAHFATFPITLIEPIIKAGCPEFICKKCGKARVKIYEKGELIRSGKGHISYGYKGNSKHQKVERSKISSWSQNFVKDNLIPGMAYEQKYRGYSDCGCNAGWESGINLDPFMGAGTTALVALTQRKRFIGIEIKQGYIDMSYKRIARVQQKIF